MRQVSRAPGSESCSLQATERKTKQMGQKESRLYTGLWRRDGKRGDEVRQKEEKNQDDAEEEVEQPTVLLYERSSSKGHKMNRSGLQMQGYTEAPQPETHHRTGLWGCQGARH